MSEKNVMIVEFTSEKLIQQNIKNLKIILKPVKRKN